MRSSRADISRYELSLSHDEEFPAAQGEYPGRAGSNRAIDHGRPDGGLLMMWWTAPAPGDESP
jgi:hypothetical protein